MSDDDDLPEAMPDAAAPAGEQAVDAATPQGLKRQRNKAERERLEADVFWKRVFADPIGRRELWYLLAACHTFEERFACGPSGFPQPEATWFHAGEQSVGLRLYQHWLAHHRDGVALMHDEHDPRFAKPEQRKRGSA